MLKLSGIFDTWELSKLIVGDITVLSPTTRERFPPDPTPLCGLGFLKRSVTQPSFTAASLTAQRLGRL